MSDTWLLYLSAAGFAASVVLWPYLLLQYRREEAPEAAEPEEPLAPLERPSAKEAPPAPQPFKVTTPPVEKAPTPVVAKPEASPRKLSPLPSAPPAQEAATLPPLAKAAGGLKTGATSPGGISPAVVYLQNVKSQLEHLEKDVIGLKEQVNALVQHSDSRFDAVLKRLGDLREELHAHPSEPAADMPPAVEPARESSVEPAPAEAPMTAAEPATLIIPPAEEVEAHPAEAPSEAPAPQPSIDLSPPPEETPSKPPDSPPPRRRGPVWPV